MHTYSLKHYTTVRGIHPGIYWPLQTTSEEHRAELVRAIMAHTHARISDLLEARRRRARTAREEVIALSAEIQAQVPGVRADYSTLGAITRLWRLYPGALHAEDAVQQEARMRVLRNRRCAEIAAHECGAHQARPK